MLIACWSAKGGSGTTVVAAALARLSAARAGSAVLADLAGDLPAAIGVPEPHSPGLAGWLEAGPEVPADALDRIAVEVGSDVTLLPRGGPLPDRRGEALAAALSALGRPTVVDCGTVADGVPLAVAVAATRSVLVIRPCYLALRRAVDAPLRPSEVVLVSEAGRALGRDDVEDALGVPVTAVVDLDPAVARAVDAGLLASRLPRSLARGLRSAA